MSFTNTLQDLLGEHDPSGVHPLVIYFPYRYPTLTLRKYTLLQTVQFPKANNQHSPYIPIFTTSYLAALNSPHLQTFPISLH